MARFGNEKKTEFYIPSIIDSLVQNGKAAVKVLPTNDSWFGVTYRQDKEIAERSIKALIEKGLYPERLV